MTRLAGALAAALTLQFFTAAPAFADKKKPKPLTASEVFKRSAPAIVAVDCQGENGTRIGTASGFIVSDNGKIVTNLHVIQSCSSLVVRLTGGDVYDSTNVIEVDTRRDLALIRIKAAALPVLPLGDSNVLEVGQVVYSIGNPSGLQNTLQQGLISGFRDMPGYKLVQVSASINPGNSGGPILDEQARVIAVAAKMIAGAENLGFAIPINYARGYLDSTTEVPFATFAATMKQARANTPVVASAAPPPAPGGVMGGILGGVPAGAGAGIGRASPPSSGPAVPKVVKQVQPEYSEAARKAHLEGTVVITLVVDENGKPRDLRVIRSLGLGLDEKALAAVGKWQFLPGTKDGKPVAAQATIQVSFRLLDKSPAPLAGGPAPSFTTISTIAGREWKFTGDGMPATQVPLGHLYGVACDRSTGNLYATDAAIHAIVKIDSEGRLHILAGPDSAPDHRPTNPAGITVDPSGIVYFGEEHRLRKLLANGETVLIAGSDKRGFSPDGSLASGSPIGNVNGVAIAPDGGIVFSEWANNRVRRVDPQGRLETVAGDGNGRFAGDGGPAVQASLLHPSGLAYDKQGNLFIADQNNGRVRKVATDGRISTVAGLGVTKDPMGCPTGVAINDNGDLFVADPCKRQVQVIRKGESSILGGVANTAKEPSGLGGPAIAASFDVFGLALNAAGDVIVSAPDHGHLYKIDRSGVFSILAGTGDWRAPADGSLAMNGAFQRPTHLAVDASGTIFLSDSDANRIYRIDQRGVVTKIAGHGHGGYDGDNTPAREAAVSRPLGIRVRPGGSIVYAERGGSNRIREISADGRIRTLAGNGRAEYSGDGGRAIDAALKGPLGICLDSAGNVYIADTENQRVRKVGLDGTIQLVAGSGWKGFAGDGGPAERASLDTPTGVEAGPDGSLYIADAGNHRVRRVLNGTITTVAGDGSDRFAGDGGPALQAAMRWPYDVAFGPDAALYVLDTSAGRIRRIDLASATITTVAGNGSHGFTGDGGPPLAAGLGRNPEGFAIDTFGNIYVVDANSAKIRLIRASRQQGAPAVPVAAVPPPPPALRVEQLASASSTPPGANGPVRISTDRLLMFMRGKIGQWSPDDAKAVLGAPTAQRQTSEGSSVTFNTPGSDFSAAELSFNAQGKLARVDFNLLQHPLKWDLELAYMKEAFPGDEFRTETRAGQTIYTFDRNRTRFVVNADGGIETISIF